MMSWGYGISEDNQIDLDNGDFSLRKNILIAEPSFAFCISCGTCTASCTAAQHTNIKIHKINLKIMRGLTKGLKNDISPCMYCGKCNLVCPRGVNIRNLILNIKKLVN